MSGGNKKVTCGYISDIVCIICSVVMAVVAVLVAIYIFTPPKAYVQEWTSPAGITYYVSNMHMQAVSGNRTN